MRVTVRVFPRSSVTEVGGRYGDTNPPILIVRVAAPAVDGKANAATIDALARALDVPRGDIRVVSGHRSRTKIVEVGGAEAGAVDGLLLS